MNVEYRFEIPCYLDREKLVVSFANSGYAVHVEETGADEPGLKPVYWVVVEPKKESRP